MPRNSMLVLNYVTIVQTALYHALYISDNTRTLEDVGRMLTMSTSSVRVKTNQPDAPPLTPGNALKDLHKYTRSRSKPITSILKLQTEYPIFDRQSRSQFTYSSRIAVILTHTVRSHRPTVGPRRPEVPSTILHASRRNRHGKILFIFSSALRHCTVQFDNYSVVYS